MFDIFVNNIYRGGIFMKYKIKKNIKPMIILFILFKIVIPICKRMARKKKERQLKQRLSNIEQQLHTGFNQQKVSLECSQDNEASDLSELKRLESFEQNRHM